MSGLGLAVLGVADYAASKLAGPAGLWKQAADECKKAKEPARPFAEAWAEYLASPPPRDRADLRLMLRGGVPRELRPEVWLHCLLKERAEETQALYTSDDVPESVAKLIDTDVPRTFAQSAEFKEAGGPAKLRSALRRFAASNVDIGYMQSLNFIAGVLVLGLGNEQPVPAAMGALVAELQARGWYSEGLEQLRADSLVLRDLLATRLPVIHGAFKTHGFEPLLVSPRWFLSLFSVTLEGEALYRAWDLILVDGIEAVFRIALALFARREEDIVRAESLDDITSLFLVPQGEVAPDVLLMAAYHKSLLGSSLDKAELERRRRHALANVSSSDDHSPGGGITAAKALAPYLFAKGTRDLMDAGRKKRGGKDGYNFGDLSLGIASKVESKIMHHLGRRLGCTDSEGMTNEGEDPFLLEGPGSPKRHPLVGVWQYGEGRCQMLVAQVGQSPDGSPELLFEEHFAGGGKLSGVMRAEGEWHIGMALLDDQTPLGSLRLQLDGVTGELVANYQAPGESTWSGDTRARRVEDPGGDSQ